MTHPIKSPRKLIEVALPLDAINEAAAREKSIRHGHPSTLHLWCWYRAIADTRSDGSQTSIPGDRGQLTADTRVPRDRAVAGHRRAGGTAIARPGACGSSHR